MDENLVSATTVEFLRLLQKGDLTNIKQKTNILQSVCKNIRNTLNPVIVSINFYEHDNNALFPFCVIDDQTKKDKYILEIDFFSGNDPYEEIFSSCETSWFTLDLIPEKHEYKQFLKQLGIKEIIAAPIVLEENAVGMLNVYLYEDTVKYNQEKYLDIITESSQLVADTLTSWIVEYDSNLQQQETELIVEMSNLTLETTEIQLILNRILPKIRTRTNIDGIGVFIKDVEEFSLIHYLGLSEDICNYYKSHQLEISNLSYYNTSSRIENVDFPPFKDPFGVILPIGSTNLMLGFLLVISESQEKLTETNIHFLRIMANQLFLTLQRKRLLDDIQQITQTSEFSSFPVMLVNNKFETIYLNNQAEKTFELDHEESAGLKLDYLLSLDSDKAKLMLQKIRDVIANIAKNTMKLDIEVFQMGKKDMRTFFVQMSPTINNLTGEYCVVLSLVDISEATKLQSIAEEYSNRSKMYLNILTHDVYNILFGISGYYEFLSDSIPQDVNPILERVNTLVKRGTAIVQDIRLLSNVLDVSTGTEIHFVPLKMTFLRVIEKTKEEFSSRKININVDIASAVKILGGAFLYDMFYYVMTSLIQKTETGETNIEISGTELHEEEEEFFEIEIVDHNGIPPESMEEIQRAIEQSPFDESLRKHLGFMIVNEIVKRYNYSLAIEEINKDDWTKGLAIKIKMQKSVDLEKEEVEK